METHVDEEVTLQENFKREQIPEEIPKETNNPIEDIRRRRSSLRRSVSSPSSNFAAICSAVDASLPPNEKMRKITELCLNQALVELKFKALENEQDAVFAFTEEFRGKIDDLLKKVENCGVQAIAQKQETPTTVHIKQMKEERSLWNEDYSRRRQAYQEAKNKLKDVMKGKAHVEAAKLKPEDVKFLNSLPDFAAMGERLTTYQNRHCIGVIHLEKEARRVYRSLDSIERQLERVQRVIAPPFQWE